MLFPVLLLSTLLSLLHYEVIHADGQLLEGQTQKKAAGPSQPAVSLPTACLRQPLGFLFCALDTPGETPEARELL